LAIATDREEEKAVDYNHERKEKKKERLLLIATIKSSGYKHYSSYKE
jgi:hypothetical protein